MLKLCLSIATGMLVAMPQASALRVGKDPGPIEPGAVELYFTGDVVVDGIPVFRQGYRIWTGSRWMPMFDTRQGERPIPKRQRRME